MDQVNILIIEDDAKIASLLKTHIQKYGYTAFTVEDFAKVMDDFRDVRPHLV